MGGCGREKVSGDWFYFYYPEVEKVEFKNPMCCGKEMMTVPTDCGYACFVCDICERSVEVED